MKERRERSGIPVKAMAEALGVSARSLEEGEAGDLMPHPALASYSKAAALLLRAVESAPEVLELRREIYRMYDEDRATHARRPARKTQEPVSDR